MTRSAFSLAGSFEYASLGRVVGVHFGAPADKVLVYDDPRELEQPYEGAAGGRLWREYAACEIAVYVRDMADVDGPFAAWFDVEMQDGARTEFDDRPLAHPVAQDLGQRVVFRDPTPDYRDNPIVEASRIALDPDGTETEMWLVEYAEAGQTRIALMLRSEISLAFPGPRVLTSAAIASFVSRSAT
jgi:hypothetical protein